MRILTLLFVVFLSYTYSFAANDNTASDAKSMALGGASVASSNIYSSINNPAFLTDIESITLATSYSNKYSLSNTQVMAALPFSFGTLGVNVSRYGSSLYSEIKSGLSYSRKFGDNFGAAVQTDLLGVMLSPVDEMAYAFTAEIGLWATPLENLTLGFHIYNFINAKYETLYNDEAVPVNMKLGLAYSIYENFSLTGEVENSSIYGTSVRGGMAYDIVEQVTFRAGAASNPALASIGLGVLVSGFNIDIAAQAVRNIGKTGAVSISYAF